MRNSAVGAPHYSLKDLAKLDDRIEAHIDGLRIAGDEGWPLCAAGLTHQESGEVFAAAVIALEGDNPRHIEQVYETVEAAPETARGLVSAIGWISRDKLRGKVAGLLGSASPLWRRVGIRACAVHRVDSGKYLTEAIEDPDPQLRARALRAAGETARRDLLSVLRGQIGSEAAECAFWAARSALLLGDRGTCLSVLQAIALTASPRAHSAIQLLLRVLDPPQSRNLLKTLSQDPERRRKLIIACGVSGDPAYIPWLIAQMGEDPGSARIAGESFSFITGVDVAHEDLEGDWPEGFEAGPTENPENEDTAMDRDEDLPWPDPERVRAWWVVNQVHFLTGTRYLAGSPVDKTNCHQVLKTGMQRQRNAAALELALMEPDAVLFETRAPGFRQRLQLGHG